MKSHFVSFSILFLALSSALAGELKNQLLGKWHYISIMTKDGPQPIHDGDYVEFRDSEVRWRWMSEDHRHLYAVQRVGNHNRFVAYQPSAPAEPVILGIFTIKAGDLIICDRDAVLGYPSKFSADQGTLLILRGEGATKAEQGALRIRRGALRPSDTVQAGDQAPPQPPRAKAPPARMGASWLAEHPIDLPKLADKTCR